MKTKQDYIGEFLTKKMLPFKGLPYGMEYLGKLGHFEELAEKSWKAYYNNNKPKEQMNITIEIPLGLAGFIRSLSLSEIDNDQIYDRVENSEHYYDCVSFGLLYSVPDPEDEEETIHYLTRLGKDVYEYKYESYAEIFQKTHINWVEDFEHENGKYVCKCISCRQHFIGNKRRVICRVCASAKTEA